MVFVENNTMSNASVIHDDLVAWETGTTKIDSISSKLSLEQTAIVWATDLLPQTSSLIDITHSEILLDLH